MRSELLTQADFVLNKCGRPKPPAGKTVVDIKKDFLLQAVVDVASPTLTFSKEITGPTTWVMRAISSAVVTAQALYWQVQLPDGRFLINSLQNINEIAGFGSYRYLVSEEILCPPGSKIQVTLDSSLADANEPQPISILFEGVYRFYLDAAATTRNPSSELSSTEPRIPGTTNQNILAPMWMSGEGPRPPAGAKDEHYVYSSGQVAIDVVTGPFSGTAAMQIDQSSDFACWRIMFDIQADATVTQGTFLVRIRAGSGYPLTDDYIDAANYIGSMTFAKNWDVAAGDTIFFDLQLVDFAGTGSMFFSAHAEGVRRVGGGNRIKPQPLVIPPAANPQPIMPQQLSAPPAGGPCLPVYSNLCWALRNGMVTREQFEPAELQALILRCTQLGYAGNCPPPPCVSAYLAVSAGRLPHISVTQPVLLNIQPAPPIGDCVDSWRKGGVPEFMIAPGGLELGGRR